MYQTANFVLSMSSQTIGMYMYVVLLNQNIPVVEKTLSETQVGEGGNNKFSVLFNGGGETENV